MSSRPRDQDLLAPKGAATGDHWSVDDLDDQGGAGYGAAGGSDISEQTFHSVGWREYRNKRTEDYGSANFLFRNILMNKSAINPQLE